ncbi:uncharacterized protein A4U43_C02F1100 [Asparagus officinalis]|uniref:Uncharacterized protein n=1 Tax=Asparagus officinalis TaxID=4686 RepID=A0A5P1FFR7_ASPOF|nr:low-temperature-induced 65 kDa protein-like [Asparagus officinalis]ONK76904.1 uncharacterized protein A4U43_C02F1100 [Asparagus officinalis]
MQATRVPKEEAVDREGLKYVENPAGEKLLLSGGEAAQTRWPAPTSPIIKSSSHETNHSHNHEHEHEHEHDHHYNELEHHHKKSVLAKVKEKAKKWKQVLTKKKHGHEGEGNMTPMSPINLDVDDEGIDQDPEYYGAPMYESETAPKMYKERAQRLQASTPSPRTPTPVLDHSPKPVLNHCPVIDLRPTTLVEAPPTTHSQEPNSTFHHSEATSEPKLHHLDSFKESSMELNSMFPANSHTLATETKVKEEETDNVKISSKTMSQTVTEILAPAYNAVSDATSKIAATIQSPVDETGAKMMWDKGISVKEYLLQKLEPGEEERALSEVITEAISPKKLGEELSVVEKVKGAVSSLLGKEEQQMENQEVKIHRTSRPLFKQSEDRSILSPKDLYQQASMARDGHGILSTGNAHAHKVSILEPKHGRGDSSPLPVSTNPSVVVPVSKNSSTMSMSMNQPAVSVSTVLVSTNPHAEVEEANGRRLQPN